MRLTSVGSFGKPDYVLEARRKFPIGHPERVEAEKKATEFWIRKQEELNYDVLVHGEMERGDMVAYFGEVLGGFCSGLKEEPVRSYGNRFWIPPEIIGKVEWKAPMTLDTWKFAQSLTHSPVKGMLTGPGTIYDWSVDTHYGSRERAMYDIARALREEIKVLISEGAKFIQIDEPSLAQSSENVTLLGEVFTEMLKGLDSYFILHTCYGKDIFRESFKHIKDFPIQNLYIESSNSGMEFLKVIQEEESKLDFTIGVVDVHTHEIEPLELVKERIEQARKVIPEDRLWIGPDCGLKTRTVEESVGKLKVISDAKTHRTI